MTDEALPSVVIQVSVAAVPGRHTQATARSEDGPGGAAELASQLGSGRRFLAEPHAVFGESRRATVGGTVNYAGVTWERVDAEDGVLAVPVGGSAGHVAALR